MSKLEIAKKVIKEYYKNARYGIYNTVNPLCGKMSTIYKDNGLRIEICYDWEYFQVFGLKIAEFIELDDYYRLLPFTSIIYN